jgi:hypothetical protein
LDSIVSVRNVEKKSLVTSCCSLVGPSGLVVMQPAGAGQALKAHFDGLSLDSGSLPNADFSRSRRTVLLGVDLALAEQETKPTSGKTSLVAGSMQRWQVYTGVQGKLGYYLRLTTTEPACSSVGYVLLTWDLTDQRLVESSIAQISQSFAMKVCP